MSKVDLHIHSNSSDGDYSVDEIMAQAESLGLEVISITDHDTIDGIKHVRSESGNGEIEVLSGLQLTVEWKNIQLEMLCYMFDVHNQRLNELLVVQRNNRESAFLAMCDKLDTLGLPIDAENILKSVNTSSLGRPHIARSMVTLGYVENTKEAFDRYLGSGGQAYIKRQIVNLSKAVDIIHSAGGIIVLAHPIIPDVPEYLNVEKIIPEIASVGVDGIEAYYTGYSSEDTERLVALANTYDLILTGGSDFHGSSIVPHCKLGQVIVPLECVEKIKQRAKDYDKSI